MVSYTIIMSKKCIFICIFKNILFLKLLYLLLESLYLYGNLDEDTHILIYTSTQFMEIIKTSKLYSNKIIFETNDNYNTVDSACKSRLDLFQFPILSNYNKILYLDTDILIINDINPIFDLIQENVIYAVEEGEIDSYSGTGWDYWGNILFGNSIHNYTDKSAFSSGVMLFNNCKKIKKVFKKVKETMQSRQDVRLCYDQPYIVYCAFMKNAYNNKSLNKWTAINDLNIYTDKTIIHFAGGVGIHQHKIINMVEFLVKYKEYNPNSVSI